MQKLNYIHYNPVEAGIVDLPEQYRFSSAGQYAGLSNSVIKVAVIDFGAQEGYVVL